MSDRFSFKATEERRRSKAVAVRWVEMMVDGTGRDIRNQKWNPRQRDVVALSLVHIQTIQDGECMQ
jgi:hypothetical protein